jgi:hypothetical protein
MDLMHKPVHPKIIYEEFPDYQKLLDDMEIDPARVILPCLPSLVANPSSSRQNRSRATPADGEGDIHGT